MGEPRNITEEQRLTILFSESINDAGALVKGVRPRRSREELARRLVEVRPWLAKVDFQALDMVKIRAAAEALIEALRRGDPGADGPDPAVDCARRLILSLGVSEESLDRLVAE